MGKPSYPSDQRGPERAVAIVEIHVDGTGKERDGKVDLAVPVEIGRCHHAGGVGRKRGDELGGPVCSVGVAERQGHSPGEVAVVDDGLT